MDRAIILTMAPHAAVRVSLLRLKVCLKLCLACAADILHPNNGEP